MSTKQPSQPSEKSDDDRIQQIEADLRSLNRQIVKIQERLHYVREKLEAVNVSPP